MKALLFLADNDVVKAAPERRAIPTRHAPLGAWGLGLGKAGGCFLLLRVKVRYSSVLFALPQVVWFKSRVISVESPIRTPFLLVISAGARVRMALSPAMITPQPLRMPFLPVKTRYSPVWVAFPSVASERSPVKAESLGMELGAWRGRRTRASTLRTDRAPPRTSNIELSTLNAQRSTLNAQRSTLNAQRSTLNAQRSTLNAQRSTLNAQRSTLNAQRSTSENPQRS